MEYSDIVDLKKFLKMLDFFSCVWIYYVFVFVDAKSYVAIKLTIDGGDDVTLETLQIRNMEDNIVTEVPFKVADKKNQFYVTDKINLPNTAFRIAVSFGSKLYYHHYAY